MDGGRWERRVKRHKRIGLESFSAGRGLGARAALAEGLGSVTSQHPQKLTTLHNSSFRGSDFFFLTSTGTEDVCSAHTYRQNHLYT